MLSDEIHGLENNILLTFTYDTRLTSELELILQ